MERIAFVLSSGGSRGAIEAGALLALLEAGIEPEILIGSSVGAVNAAALALKPDLEGARWLVDAWISLSRRKRFRVNYASIAWRFATRKPSFFSNRVLKEVLAESFFRDVHYFGDIQDAKLYIGAVRLDSGKLKIFGSESHDSLLDAVMASTAAAPFLPPWTYQNVQYIDCSSKSALPVSVAVHAKATEVYAIDVGVRNRFHLRCDNVFQVIEQVTLLESYEHFLGEIGWSKVIPKDKFHYISIPALDTIRSWDFTHTEEMIDLGKMVTEHYLKNIASHDRRNLRLREQSTARQHAPVRGSES